MLILTDRLLPLGISKSTNHTMMLEGRSVDALMKIISSSQHDGKSVDSTRVFSNHFTLIILVP